VELPDSRWQEKHWRTFESNYRRAAHFGEVAAVFEPLYRKQQYTHLSSLNRALIEAVCGYLGIATMIRNSWDYNLIDGKSERVADLCAQAKGTVYVSGPAAKDYLDERAFSARGIKLTWFDYTGYREYPQLWGEFTHRVTILDVLFNL